MVMAVTVKTGKLLDGIVIAGVIAIGPFVAIIAERHFAFEHDLRFRRHFAAAGSRNWRSSTRCAAQQSGELIFGQRVGHRRHGGEDGAGIGAEHGGGGQRRGFSFAQRA